LSEEERVRRLADLKAYLERRIRELNEEVLRLRSYLEAVDASLAERSFRKVEVPKSIGPPTAQVQGSAGAQVVPVATVTGVHLADMMITGDAIRIVPDPKIRYEVNSPPLRAFLIGRILEQMQQKDQEAARAGQISPEKMISYRIDQENAVIREITINNYGDEKRLFELKNAIRWTFRRMYEKLTV